MENINVESPTKHRGYFSFMFNLYKHGFRTMSRTSKTLWIIALIKLFIMFAILKPFFFPSVIAEQGDRSAQTEYVVEQLTKD